MHPSGACININDKILKYYFESLLPLVAAKGDDGNYAATAASDLACLQVKKMNLFLFDGKEMSSNLTVFRLSRDGFISASSLLRSNSETPLRTILRLFLLRYNLCSSSFIIAAASSVFSDGMNGGRMGKL